MDRARHDAFAHLAEQLRTGSPVTEYSVQQFLRERYAAEGMITDHGPIVAANAKASDPHYEPTPESHQAIKKGDLVLIDMWAKLDQPEAVYYDITWTGFCGESAPDKIQNVFRVVRDARDAAVDFVMNAKGPICGYQVDDAARNHIESKGFGEWFIHRTGHSIGTNVHGSGANMDNFETHDERRIVPRTCFSVEPGVYLPDFGIRSEVNVYVGENGARVTGEAQTELVQIL
jgi:Xaa-Pro aminopeptidase